MGSMRSFIAWMLFALAPCGLEALTEINTNRKCFTTPPGNASRGSVTLKLGVRNSASHQVSSAILEILFKEYMGYTVKAYDLSSKDAKDWGADISSNLYDIDVENMEAVPGSEAYMQYITQAADVVDAGSIGYTLRKGFYVTPGAVTAHPSSTWFEYYQDAPKVKASNFVTFGVDSTTSTCTEDWCGTGAMKGYWAPSQCVTTPANCAVALMENAGSGEDLARFEQLVQNSKINFIHAYLGGSMVAKIKSFQAAGKEVIFLSNSLDPLVQSLKALRIEFPDWVPGCDSPSTRNPSGGITCDYGKTTLRKLMHSRLRKVAAEAYYVTTQVKFYTDIFTKLLATTTAGGGSKTPYEAACSWLKSSDNTATVASWVPPCISHPPANPVTGNKIFDFFTLECKEVLAFPNSPAPKCYKNSPRPGNIDRSSLNVKVCWQYWLSQRLSMAVATIILTEFLGYSATLVDMSSASTSDIFKNIEGGACAIDAESWQASHTGANYLDYVVGRRTVLNPNDIGYFGRSAHFVTPGILKADKLASYYKFYTNLTGTDLKKVTTMFGDAGKPGKVPTMQSYDTGFPACSSPWCNSNPASNQNGYWAPPWCQGSRATECALVIHPVSSYDTAYFETLTKTLGMNFAFSYYGWGASTLIKKLVNEGSNTIFYWWAPDPLIGAVSAKRLSYPDSTYGCDRDNTKDPDTGKMGCDYAGMLLEKLVAPSIKNTMPEAYYAISKLKMRKEEIELMMPRHAEGGGNESSHYQVACDWVKANEQRIASSFAPPCVSRPKKTSDLKIGDSVFDPIKIDCIKIECLPDQVILAGESTGVSCKTCGAGLVPNAAKTDCEGCPAGSAPNRTAGVCQPCKKGYACRYGTESAVACDMGRYAGEASQLECTVCERGRYQTKQGQSACISCPSSMTSALLGSRRATDCICPADMYKPNNVTRSDGMPWTVGPFAGKALCLPCPPGMNCKEASAQENIPCRGGVYEPSNSQGYKDRMFPVPKVGHYTECSGLGPLSTYMCLSDQACPGNDVNTCLEGAEGIACGRCKLEWYKSGNLCKKCNDVETSNVIFPVFPIIAAPIPILLLYRASRDNIEKWNSPANQLAACLFLILVYIQSLAAMSSCYINMPPTVEDTTEWTVYTYEIMSLLRPGCTTFNDFVTAFIGKLLLPVYALIAFIVVFLGSLVTGLIFGPRWRMDGHVIMNCYWATFNTFFIGIAQQTLTLFQCYEHPNKEKSMRSQADIMCGGDDWTSLLAVAIVCALIFCVGFLALNIYLIWVAPREFNNEIFRRKWKFLFIKFRPSCYWWGIVLLTKAIWMNLPTVVFDYGAAQILWLMTILLVYLVSSIAMLPWRTFIIGCLDIIMHAMLTFLFVPATHFVDMGDASNESLGVMMAIISYIPLVVGGALLLLLVYRRFFARPAPDEFWTNSAEACVSTFKIVDNPTHLAEVLKNLPFADVSIISTAKKILDCEMDQFNPGMRAKNKPVLEGVLMKMLSRDRLTFDKNHAPASSSLEASENTDENDKQAKSLNASAEDVTKMIQLLKDNLKPDDVWLCNVLELATNNQPYDVQKLRGVDDVSKPSPAAVNPVDFPDDGYASTPREHTPFSPRAIPKGGVTDPTTPRTPREEA